VLGPKGKRKKRGGKKKKSCLRKKRRDFEGDKKGLIGFDEGVNQSEGLARKKRGKTRYKGQRGAG